MSSVDNRVVKMQFDNASFKKEALATKASLDQVDAAVAKAGKGRGLLDMAGHMQAVAVKASAMQVATVTAIANIANKAVNAGLDMAKSLTFDPIKSGFNEYELKMKSIRTILANTEGENLKSVTGYLDDLNEYSDKTIYNFANMTQNIGKMTTAGIKLGTATEVVKGFSNMVALSGGDSMAAAGALEQFVYGLQAGKITALDWQSIATRGLGSVSLQKAFYETAKAAGTLGDVPVSQTYDEWSKSVGGFKGSLETGWLTADVATDALSIMTGDVKDVSELMKQGFSQQAAEDLIDIAGKASLAATEVYSFTTFMDTLKEQIGSGWAKVMESVIGDVDEATALFTGWADTTGKILNKMFGYIGRLAAGWSKMGGQAASLKAIQHVLSPIASILGLIAHAFKAAFGGSETGRGLASFSKALEQITRPLSILGKLIRGDLTPLQALGRMLQWAGGMAEGTARFIGRLVERMFDLVGIDIPSGGGLLGWIKNLSTEVKDAIKQVGDLLEKGASLKEALGKVDINLPGLPSLPDVPKMDTSGLPDINGMFSGFNTNGATSELDSVSMSLAGVSAESSKAATVGDKVMPAVQKAWDGLKSFFSNFDIEKLMSAFNLAVLSTFIISISRFMNTFSKSIGGFAALGPSVVNMINSLGGSLDKFASAANKQAWAKIILNVAIGIGILAVSLWLLSKIPFGQMMQGLLGLAGIMIIMKVGLDSVAKAVEKMDGKGTTFKLAGLSVALVALGVAILLLAAAFLILNMVKWGSMLKGLGTIIIVMLLLEKMGKVGEHGAKNLMASAVALTAMAFAILVLAGALLLFQLVKWESMAKGGLVLGALVGALYLLAKLPAAAIAKVGTSMLAASFGFLLLANALLIFQLVKWESIGKGAVALALLTGSLAVLQMVGNPVAIAGLVGLGLGMIGLATAMLILNKVDWSSIAKAGLIMVGLLAGFALLLAIVYIGAPAVALLSGLAVSLALLAGAVALLAFAFAIILPLMAIGVGAFAAFATGAAVAIGVFLTSLALQAPIMKKSVLVILQTLIDTIVEAVPMVIDGFKRLFEAIKKEFSGGGKGGGQMQASMSKSGESWIQKLGEGIKKRLPQIVSVAGDLIVRFIHGLASRAGEIGSAGITFIASLINGITSRIGEVTDAAVNLIIKFVEGIASGYSKILNAGVKLIADFLHALADTIRNGSAAIGAGLTDVIDAMRDVGVNIVKGLIAGLESMVGDALGAIADLAQGMIDKGKSVLEVFSPSRVFKKIGTFLVEGLTKGIQDNAAAAIVAVGSMVSGQIAVANEYISGFIQKLDQQSLAATAKAQGLQSAAEKASRAADKAAKRADKTKTKKDDRKANKVGDRADKISKAADRAAARAEREQARTQQAIDAQDRAAEFAEASLLDKAKMRSEDAQAQMDSAKAAEMQAAANLIEADALDRAAKGPGLTKKERKAMKAEADRLRKAAEVQAREANAQIRLAGTSAADALLLQTQAGAEAARMFREQFDAQAKEDADEAAFNKLDDTQKAATRRAQAQAMQDKANADLSRAQDLAYTDLEGANALAEEAMDQAEQARQYLLDAEGYEEQARQDAEAKRNEVAAALGETGSVSAEVTGGTVVNLDPTEAAAIAFNQYADRFDSATAAAAGERKVEFNQYNTSPEALNPTEVYRKTNNLFTHAAQKLEPAA